MRKETRFFDAVEVRVVAEEGKAPAIEGYAAVFNTLSRDLGGFKERVMPGTFARALRDKADVVALVNHDPNMLLGRTKSGTLTLAEDGKGLRFRAELPDTQYARDLVVQIKRGDLDQCSFSFTAPPEGQKWSDEKQADGKRVATRDLLDVDLFDVSAVTFPAYEGTSVLTRDRWAEVVPLEVRSLVEGHERDDVIESRIYKDASEAPDYVPADKKAQWIAVWNSAYAKAIEDGKEKDDAEKSAFAQANAVVGPKSGENAAPVGKKRDCMDSYEDVQRGINEALKQKFGNTENGWQKVWLVETYLDNTVIVCQEGNQYFKVGYVVDLTTDQVTIAGELEPMVQTYVPSEHGVERGLRNRCQRTMTANMVERAKRNWIDDVSDPDSSDYDPEDPDFDPDWEARSDHEMDDVNEVKVMLQEAIKMHEAHMADPETATPDSQKALLEMMQAALGELDDDLVKGEHESEDESNRRRADLEAKFL